MSIIGITAHAQVRLDVKTSWSEKKGLAAAKLGLLSAIDAAEWAANEEFGEDYAVWLRNLRKFTGTNDSLIVALDIEIREPSLFGPGTLKGTEHVEVRYRIPGAGTASPTDAAFTRAEERARDIETYSDLISGAVASFVPKGGSLVRPVLQKILTGVGIVPRHEEIVEAVILGTAVEAALRKSLSRPL